MSTAWEQLQLAMKNHYLDPTVESRDKVNVKNKDLRLAYLTAQEKSLTEMCRRVESVTDQCKSKESWNIISEIARHKRRA